VKRPRRLRCAVPSRSDYGRGRTDRKDLSAALEDLSAAARLGLVGLDLLEGIDDLRDFDNAVRFIKMNPGGGPHGTIGSSPKMRVGMRCAYPATATSLNARRRLRQPALACHPRTFNSLSTCRPGTRP